MLDLQSAAQLAIKNLSVNSQGLPSQAPSKTNATVSPNSCQSNGENTPKGGGGESPESITRQDHSGDTGLVRMRKAQGRPTGIEHGAIALTCCQPGQPVPLEVMRTIVSAIESMQQQGRLTISAETEIRSVPVKDFNGEIYRWEKDYVETGRVIAKVKDITEFEESALSVALIPGEKKAIHAALERLAQIKPIGRSEAKQSSVISYLVHDLLDEEISEFIVNELCRRYRRSTEVFFPNSGDFFQAAVARKKELKLAVDEIEKGEMLEWKKNLCALIGAQRVKGWFEGAVLKGQALHMGNKFKADWVRQQFMGDLKKIGVTEIRLLEEEGV